MKHVRASKGFTLIELSVVLVIIGLIVGGIVTGRTLIRQSQMNSAATDVQRYIQATQNFQQKYGALPGDFATASTYWGLSGTCPPNAGTLTPPTTCNGDGNGQIGTGGIAATAAPWETFYYWEHLSNAGFIQGGYTGNPGSAGSGDYIFSTNAPLTRMDGTGLGITYAGTVTSGSTYFQPNSFGHVYFLGGYESNALPTGNIMSTGEASNIDSKFDDGYPGSGNIQTYQRGMTYLCPSSASIPSTYTSGNSATYQCFLIFITGF